MNVQLKALDYKKKFYLQHYLLVKLIGLEDILESLCQILCLKLKKTLSNILRLEEYPKHKSKSTCWLQQDYHPYNQNKVSGELYQQDIVVSFYTRVTLIVWISFSHLSLSSIAPGMSSRLHSVSAQTCCRRALVDGPTLAQRCEGVYGTLLMSLSLLSAMSHMSCLIWMVLEMGDVWPYSCYFVGCYSRIYSR